MPNLKNIYADNSATSFPKNKSAIEAMQNLAAYYRKKFKKMETTRITLIAIKTEKIKTTVVKNHAAIINRILNNPDSKNSEPFFFAISIPPMLNRHKIRVLIYDPAAADCEHTLAAHRTARKRRRPAHGQKCVGIDRILCGQIEYRAVLRETAADAVLALASPPAGDYVVAAEAFDAGGASLGAAVSCAGSAAGAGVGALTDG